MKVKSQRVRFRNLRKIQIWIIFNQKTAQNGLKSVKFFWDVTTYSLINLLVENVLSLFNCIKYIP